METLQRTIERWMGVEAPQAGEGTAWRIEHSFPWPPWVLLLFCVAAVVFVVYLYRREGRIASTAYKMLLAGMRLLLIGLALVMLSEAMLSIDRTGLPYVAVLVDQSGSMSVEDQYASEELQEAAERTAADGRFAEASRWNLAKSILLRDEGRLLKRLQRGHKLRLYLVAGSAQLHDEYVDAESLSDGLAELRALEPLGSESRSRLGTAMRQVLDDLRGTPPAALVYLSDGITTDGEPLEHTAEYARTRHVPLFTVALGDPEPVRDLRLYDLLVDEVALLGDLITFQAKLRASGYEGRTVEVKLCTEGSEAPLERQTLTLGAEGESVPVRISYEARQAGDFDFLLEVDPLEEEVQTANNVVRRRVSVRDEKIKVLVVEAYPRYEFRYLKHLLERDPTVVLDTVLQEADPDYVQQDRTAMPLFPVRREDLFEYDVVIFGDVNRNFLGGQQLANLDVFVREKGGGLAVIAGPLYTPMAYQDSPLAVLLPVEVAGAAPLPAAELTQSFQPVLTPEGRVSPLFHFGRDQEESYAIWRDLPGFFWLMATPKLKPGAVPLAVHPSRKGEDGPIPVFTWQFAGAGKVLFSATDDVWRWRYRVGDAYLNHFWVQVVRFLSRSKLIGKEVQAEVAAYRLGNQWGDPVQLRVRFFDETQTPLGDDSVSVTVERSGAGAEVRTVPLRRLPTDRNVFEGMLTNPGEGSYHARLSEPVLANPPAADFVVTAPAGEFQQVQTDASALRQAAETTDGKFYTLSDVGGLADDVPPGERIRLDTDQSIPLWNTWVVLGLFLMLLVGEWLLRKRKRML